MRAIPLLLVVALASSLTACYSVKSRSSYDSRTDFGGLKTFAWTSDLGEQFADPARRDLFTETMEAELATRSLRKDDAAPDFLIRVHRYDSYREAYDTLHGGVGFDKRMMRVDFVDPKTDRALWEMAASAYISDDADLEEVGEVYEDGLKVMLKHFPPATAD